MITRESIFTNINGKETDLRNIIKYNDEKTIKYLASGKYLTGIFQLNKDVSANMLKTIFAHLLEEKDIKDITEEDVIGRLSDITTLIRPACIIAGADKRYYKRLCGEKVDSPVSMDSPFYDILLNITSKTQLELLYQEQIMRVLEAIFKISAGTADNYRRAFEKGDKVKLESYKKEFWIIWSKELEGKYNKKQIAEYCKEFWEYLLSVSGYLFNLSHAVAYSYQTYITAYIKVTVALMIAVTMNRHSTDKDKITKLLSEAFKLNIKINLPKLNQAYSEATPVINGDNQEVYLSCESIKGIGKAVSNKISSRNNFNSIEEFLQFASRIKLNKAVMSLLVKIGFFSEYCDNKAEVWGIIDSYYDITTETREMKFVKKYNKFIYNAKKGEVIKKLDEVNNIAVVDIMEKKWDMGIYEEKYSNNRWNEYFLQKDLIGFPLFDVKDMYSNYDCGEVDVDVRLSNYGKKFAYTPVYQDIIIVDNIRYGEKNNYKWTIVKDGQENTYFIPSNHALINENDILYITYFTNAKGNTILEYKMIDHIC